LVPWGSWEGCRPLWQLILDKGTRCFLLYNCGCVSCASPLLQRFEEMHYQ
jgi:hypothetical protein